jgi:HSP20 family molecular chaperone IbpA
LDRGLEAHGLKVNCERVPRPPPREFSDVLTLLAEVDGEKAEASYVNGILTITLPKAENTRPKVIKVTTTF